MSQPAPAMPLQHLVVRVHDTVPVLVVPADVPFERLREQIRAEMPELLAELGGRAVRLDLGAREIQLFDVRRLLHLLRDDFTVDVTGLYVRSEAVHRYAERELKLRLFVTDGELDEDTTLDDAEDAASEPAGPLPGLASALAALTGDDTQDVTDETDAVPAVVEPDEADADAGPIVDDEAPPLAFDPRPAHRRPIPLPEFPKDEEPEVDEQGGRRVLTVTRTLRSGGAVRYDGDVHVFGDVNAGAQVRAGGNVIVFGRLRGTVHAGANGDESAFILALDLSPTQLRIARHIAIAPERPPTEGYLPEIAAVDAERIVIEPYRGRLVRR